MKWFSVESDKIRVVFEKSDSGCCVDNKLEETIKEAYPSR